MPTTHNGWSAVKKTLTPLRLPDHPTTGKPVNIKVRSGSVWVVFNWLLRVFSDTVEAIDPRQTWGHSYRQIAGSQTWSNHASGTAVDLNSKDHPFGKRKTFTADQAKACRTIEKSSLGVLKWGDHIPDEMHWEIAQGVTAGRVEKFAVKLLQGALATAAGAAGEGDYPSPLLDPGPVDGIRGRRTLKATRAFQTAAGLNPDGIDGPLTWEALNAVEDYGWPDLDAAQEAPEAVQDSPPADPVGEAPAALSLDAPEAVQDNQEKEKVTP